MRGTVKFFDKQKGWGFIAGDNGTDYFVHYSNLKDTFIENFQFLNESGIFADGLGWTYEKNCNLDKGYIFETGRINPECNVIVTVQICVKDDVSMDEMEKILLVEEED